MERQLREVEAFEAKNRLGALLDRVEHGEEIIITRHGKPVARLVPVETGFDQAKAQRVVRGLLEASTGVTLNRLRLEDLIAEGRA
jgi:prevent-host-death family protein